MLKFLAGSVLALSLAACNTMMPAAPGTQPPLPGPGPALSPTPRPTPTPRISPTPAPTAPVDEPAANACPTPPPDDCCAIIYGALHGTLVDEDDQPIVKGNLTLRTASGRLMGNCSEALASPTPQGEFAFNAVPFEVALILEASAPGYEPLRVTTRLPKGPLQRVTVRLRRAAGEET